MVHKHWQKLGVLNCGPRQSVGLRDWIRLRSFSSGSRAAIARGARMAMR